MIQTHSTRRLDENDRVTTDGIEPGLTLRDIRFAVQLENLLDSPNNLIARVSDSTDYPTDRDFAWNKLLSEYPFRALEPTDTPTFSMDNNSDNLDSSNSDNPDSSNSDNPNSSYPDVSDSNSSNSNKSNKFDSSFSSDGPDILETLEKLARQ